MDAVQQSADAEVDSLERLYLAPAEQPGASADPLAAAKGGAPCEEQQQQQQKRRHKHRDQKEPEEVCGKLACAQHVERRAGAPVPAADGAADAGAAPEEEATSPASSGFLGRLLDLVPLSPRTRGILMLNLLVLLVATNWVSPAFKCQHDLCGQASLCLCVNG